MKHLPRLVGLAVAVALVIGGCPLPASDPAGAAASHSGRSGSSSGGTPGGSGSSSGGGSAASGSPTGSPAVGGDSSANLSSPDALSVQFPGCEDPNEGMLWQLEVLRLVNQERSSRGLAAVTWNDTLADQAADYACQLIYYRYFDHVNPFTGSELAERAAEFEYEYWIIGENLAAGQRSPVEVVDDWMNSPCHRENVLNPAFTELGVSIRYGGDYGYYWVQEFGRPFAAGPYPGPAHRDPECSREN